jgi:hypothetical protein
LAFLLSRDDFPLPELGLRFEGGFELGFGSGIGSGDGVEGVGSGEDCLEMACAALRTAIALSMTSTFNKNSVQTTSMMS